MTKEKIREIIEDQMTLNRAVKVLKRYNADESVIAVLKKLEFELEKDIIDSTRWEYLSN